MVNIGLTIGFITLLAGVFIAGYFVGATDEFIRIKKVISALLEEMNKEYRQ